MTMQTSSPVSRASGLSEKEARLYLHLLKHGPRTPSPLAKTSKKRIAKTCTGRSPASSRRAMVRPSLDSPTVYAAVDLDTALEAALKKHESELREMDERKRELQELSQQQRFHPDEVSTFKIIKSILGTRRCNVAYFGLDARGLRDGRS